MSVVEEMTRSQEIAYALIIQWFKNRESMVYRLGGPAGSGKSWLIAKIAEYVGFDDCLLMTPTGKASNNLIKAGLQAHTIHSQIYRNQYVKQSSADCADMSSAIDEYNRAMTADRVYAVNDYNYRLKQPSAWREKCLFIVDEGSMVGDKLLNDILTFNVPVLLVGDPNQLDPVNDRTVFTKCDYYLTEIVRQAQDSPVIWLSQQILNGKLPAGTFGTCQVRWGGVADNEIMFANQVLTDTNVTRDSLNEYIRKLWFGNQLPVSPFVRHDKIICRTNSMINSDSGYTLTNGAQGIISDIYNVDCTGTYLKLKMHTEELGDFVYQCTTHPEYFKPEQRPPKIEYAYAITVHLSQGSEWDRIIYVVSNGGSKSALYTAVTRAKQGVLVALQER